MYYYELFSKLPISQINIDINELKKGLKGMRMAIDFNQSPDDKIEFTLKEDIRVLTDKLDDFDKKYSELEKSY